MLLTIMIPNLISYTEQMRGMADSPERRVIIAKNAIFFIVRDLPWVVENHRLTYELVHPWLKNYKPGYISEHC